jgi:apolipoprotein D and lipocalin family protein
MKTRLGYVILVATAICAMTQLSSCMSTQKDPPPVIARVDIPRYMGRWYVIASIPTFFEKNAYNATETYELQSDGTIGVTFRYLKGAFDGPVKTMKPHGFVQDASGAIWGMRIFWPIKAEYLISYLNDDYSQVIVGRTARDHVWMMARTPQISADDYQKLEQRISSLGYDMSKLQKVPQRWQ